jgi:predicted transcriptional regulator
MDQTVNFTELERKIPSGRKPPVMTTTTKKKPTQLDIYNNCRKKYLSTKEHISSLVEKKKKIEDEIEHLQAKQSDRKKFLDEVQERLKKN